MYSISIFYFTFYLLGGGCVRTQRTPPAYGPVGKVALIRTYLDTDTDLLQAGPLFRQNVGAPNI